MICRRHTGRPTLRLAAIEAEAGRDSAQWRARSPLAVATNIKCPVLVLHGEDDHVAPAESAHAYVSALQAAGATVDARFQSGRGHDISPLFARSSAFQYLRKLYGL
jgi:dipeptidyl aminopeptidase/acylaminoacyl peptidase